MQFGVNLARKSFFPLIQRLHHERRIDFVEVLVDGFLHHDPRELRQELGDIPVALHIMTSHFLETPESDLRAMAAKIRRLAAALAPLYISDHLAQFRSDQRLLPIPAELQYEDDYPHIRDRVARWQDMLGAPLYCEAFPSADAHGRGQPQFFERLIADTGARLLFDFSNVVIGDINQGAPRSEWLSVAARCEHFHVAGYRVLDGIAIDTHDTDVSEESLDFIEQVAPSLTTAQTIVVERDSEFTYESVAADLAQVTTRLTGGMRS